MSVKLWYCKRGVWTIVKESCIIAVMLKDRFNKLKGARDVVKIYGITEREDCKTVSNIISFV